MHDINLLFSAPGKRPCIICQRTLTEPRRVRSPRDCPGRPCRSVWCGRRDFEPPQLSSLEPKSSASTNSATPAKEQAVRRRCRGRRAYNTQVADDSKKMTPLGRVRGLDTEPKNGPAISMMRPAPSELSPTPRSGPACPARRSRCSRRPGAVAAGARRRRRSRSSRIPPEVVFDPAPPATLSPRRAASPHLEQRAGQRIALGIRGSTALRAAAAASAPPLEPRQPDCIDVELSQAGTFVLEACLVDDDRPGRPIAAFTVAETTPPQVDQDRIVLLIEDAQR